MKSKELQKKYKALAEEANRVWAQAQKTLKQEKRDSVYDELKNAKFFEVEITTKRTVLATSKQEAIELVSDVTGDSYDEDIETYTTKAKATELNTTNLLKKKDFDLFAWVADEIVYDDFLCHKKHKELIKLVASIQKERK